MQRVRTALLACMLVAGASGVATADIELECYSDDPEIRIRGCTAILQRPNLPPETRSGAFASRALGHSLKRDYGRAIQDYDRAIELVPDFATALNNRAWAYFKWGKPQLGRNDVEKSLALAPDSGAAYDTRAHIAQSAGDASSALRDYNFAILYGGELMITMYQCGLQEQGLYKGARDGKVNAELRAALKICVENPKCDPLPADEFCRPAAS